MDKGIPHLPWLHFLPRCFDAQLRSIKTLEFHRLPESNARLDGCPWFVSPRKPALQSQLPVIFVLGCLGATWNPSHQSSRGGWWNFLEPRNQGVNKRSRLFSWRLDFCLEKNWSKKPSSIQSKPGWTEPQKDVSDKNELSTNIYKLYVCLVSSH